jgi:2-desacetyl-2-hydroxyethyl bacteriochlorophyllide A dehydrogenase
MYRARRILFPGIRQAAWEEVVLPAPDQLGPTDVLIRTARTLVSAGTEIAIYSGSHISYTLDTPNLPRVPTRTGYCFAGTVEAVGSEVTTVRPGDRVGARLGHADWVKIDIAKVGLVPLPDDVSFEQACLAGMTVFPLQGARLANVQIGEHVVVFGQGLVGQFARQLATIAGAVTVIAIDLIDGRLDIAQRHGATHVANPSRDDPFATIAAATNGRGADVVIEASGNPALINDALRAAAMLGRVILLGSPRGRVEIDPYSDIHKKGVSLIGAHVDTTARPANAYNRWTPDEHYRLGIELMRQGRLRTDGLVSHRVPAADALEVFDALTDRPHEHLGVIIEWS